MSEQKVIANNLEEEQRVGQLVAEALTNSNTTNETVCNVLFNLLLQVIEEGNVTGAMSSETITLTISRNNKEEV